jgi:predicted dehydrogenase
MITAAKKAGRRLLVFQTHRFSRQFLELKRIADASELGKRLFGTVQYLGMELERILDETSWKCSLDLAGGGVLLDGGVHVTDLANWFFGRPVSVMAQTRMPQPWPANKGESTGQLLVTYEDGAVAQVVATFEARLKNEGGLRITAQIYFEQGNAYAEYVHLGGMDTARIVRRVDPAGVETVAEPGADEGLNHVEHVIDCLTGKAEPIVTAEEARMAVAVVEAAYESARTRKEVEVPPLR